MNLILAGDLVPTQRNIELFNNANIEELIGDKLQSLLNDSDIRIINLEVPLTDKEYPIAKNGPNLIAPTSTIKGIKGLNPTLITLANNHILDQGEQGLTSTKHILNKNGIPFVGIGNNLLEASEPYIFIREGLKIGIYVCVEHEFSIATEITPGANPFDPLESLDHIQKLKTKSDYVIVLYHGGKEHYCYPSPYLQKICRKMVKKGADLVICQHSHCIGCYEDYEGAKIIYGQGNFIFDYSENEFWKTSLIIKVCHDDGLRIEYIPIIKVNNGVRLAEGQVAQDILTAFYKRSSDILQTGFIEEQYRELAKENLQFYLKKLFGFGKWFNWIDKRLLNSMLLKRKHNNKQILAIRNFIECEAHRELLLTGLRMRDE